MESELVSEYVKTLKKGDKISLILAGVIVDGTYEGIEDDCVVLTDATSPSIKKKHYNLTIPVASIYAWGQKQKSKKVKK